MKNYDDDMTGKMSNDDKKMFKTYANKCQAENDLATLLHVKAIREDVERYDMALACAKSKAKLMNLVAREADDNDD